MDFFLEPLAPACSSCWHFSIGDYNSDKNRSLWLNNAWYQARYWDAALNCSSLLDPESWWDSTIVQVFANTKRLKLVYDGRVATTHLFGRFLSCCEWVKEKIPFKNLFRWSFSNSKIWTGRGTSFYARSSVQSCEITLEQSFKWWRCRQIKCFRLLGQLFGLDEMHNTEYVKKALFFTWKSHPWEVLSRNCIHNKTPLQYADRVEAFSNRILEVNDKCEKMGKESLFKRRNFLFNLILNPIYVDLLPLLAVKANVCISLPELGQPKDNKSPICYFEFWINNNVAWPTLSLLAKCEII